MVKEYHAERQRIQKQSEQSRVKIEAMRDRASAAIERLIGAIADGGADFAEVRAALSAKKAEKAAAEKALSEMEAAPIIVLHPHVAELYRKKIGDLIDTLNDGEEIRQTAINGIRGIIDRVEIHAEPIRRGPWHIEVITSIAATIEIAAGRSMPFPKVTTEVVAEEGLEPPTRGL